jgi:hypothetical protein
MKPEQPNKYNTRVDAWLREHGITFAIIRIGAECGFDDGSSGDREHMHDTYAAAFSRTHTGSGHDKPVTDSLVVPKFYQSSAHSESAGAGTKCIDKRCGVQYRERSAHQYGCKPAQPEIPSAYTILSSITTHDPGTFRDFCYDYGYDMDSRKAERTYFAVQDEWERVRKFFSADELDELREIAQ